MSKKPLRFPNQPTLLTSDLAASVIAAPFGPPGLCSFPSVVSLLVKHSARFMPDVDLTGSSSRFRGRPIFIQRQQPFAARQSDLRILFIGTIQNDADTFPSLAGQAFTADCE